MLDGFDWTALLPFIAIGFAALLTLRSPVRLPVIVAILPGQQEPNYDQRQIATSVLRRRYRRTQAAWLFREDQFTVTDRTG